MIKALFLLSLALVIAITMANPDPFCTLAPVTGKCRGYFPRYYYSTEKGSCQTFIYGGCGGNRNNFETLDDCRSTCRPTENTESFCTLPPVTGKCKGYFPRYYYSTENGRCEMFIYGGCGGNRNNFETSDECSATCNPRE